jgi:hypothetical protein
VFIACWNLFCTWFQREIKILLYPEREEKMKYSEIFFARESVVGCLFFTIIGMIRDGQKIFIPIWAALFQYHYEDSEEDNFEVNIIFTLPLHHFTTSPLHFFTSSLLHFFTSFNPNTFL